MYSIIVSNDLPKPVLRSFDDFLELHRKLRSKLPDSDIPKLPKIGFSLFNQSKFLEQRKADLQIFLDRMSSARYLSTCPHYLDFICPDVNTLINTTTGVEVPWKPLPSSEVLLIYAPVLPPSIETLSKDLSDTSEIEHQAISLLNEVRTKVFSSKSPAETTKVFSAYKEKIEVAGKQIDDVIKKIAEMRAKGDIAPNMSNDVRATSSSFLHDAEEVAKSAKKFVALLARAEDYAASSAAKVRYFRATRKVPEIVEWGFWYQREIDRLSKKVVSEKIGKDEVERKFSILKLEIQKDLSAISEKIHAEKACEEGEKTNDDVNEKITDDVNGKIPSHIEKKYEMLKGKLNNLVNEIDTVVEILKKNDLTFYFDFKVTEFEKEIDELVKSKEENADEIDEFKKYVDEFMGMLNTDVAEQNEIAKKINDEILSKI